MMLWLYQTLARIRSLWSKSPLDRQVEEELATHIELATEENLRSGMPPDAARRKALLKLGSRDAAMELHRETRGVPFVENLIQDVRYAIRSLAKRPLLLATTTLSIAIGVGLNVAMYSVLHRLLFEPEITANAPEGLVRIGPELSYPNFEDLRDSNIAAGLAARQVGLVTWKNTNTTATLSARIVSENFFEVAGVRPLLGQAFGPAGDAGSTDVAERAVIAFEFWQRRLGGSPAVIGQTLNLNGWPYVVAGVLPNGFYSMIGPMVSADVYVPISARVSRGLNERGASQFDLIGRRRSDMTREQTLAAFRVAAQQLESRFPQENRDLGRTMTVSPINGVSLLDETPLRRMVFAAAGALYVLVGLVLLVACLNVAGILVARAVERGREISIRTALGATRGRIIQQFLAESLIVGTLGCAAGSALWIVCTTALPKAAFIVNAGINIIPAPLPFLYCLTLTVVITICCGLAPALSANQSVPGVGLKSTRGAFGVRRWSLGRLLVVAQVAVCFVLLTGGSVLLVSLLRQQVVDPGFDFAHTVSIQLILPTAFQPGQALPRSFTELRGMIEQVPDVEAVTCVRSLPPGLLRVTTRAHRSESNREVAFDVDLAPVGPKFFETMGIPLDRGRDFNDEDLRFASSSETMVIINRTLAERYFRGEDPLGQSLVLDETGGTRRDRILRIVGVARDSKLRSLNEDAYPFLYLPETSRALIVRVAGSPDAAVRKLEGLFADREPGAVVTVVSMNHRLAVALRPARLGAEMLMGMGGLAVVLAMIGVYGIVSYTVSRRTFEIGIRMALGAKRPAVVRMILFDAVRMIGAGSLIGGVLSFGLVAVLRPLLAPGQRITSPLSLAAVFTMLLIIGIAVSLRPAGRAATVDPMIALRHE